MQIFLHKAGESFNANEFVRSEFDGSVLNEEGAFIGRVLPDGSVAGVPQKSLYNTMPYIAHTVAQGLALGLKKEIFGKEDRL